MNDEPGVIVVGDDGINSAYRASDALFRRPGYESSDKESYSGAGSEKEWRIELPESKRVTSFFFQSYG